MPMKLNVKKFGQRLFTTLLYTTELYPLFHRSARILSLLSEEGVYTETLEKFCLSSVLVTHSCL